MNAPVDAESLPSKDLEQGGKTGRRDLPLLVRRGKARGAEMMPFKLKNSGRGGGLISYRKKQRQFRGGGKRSFQTGQ